MKTLSSSKRRKAEVKVEGQNDPDKIKCEEKTKEDERKVDQGRSSSSTGLHPTENRTISKEVTFTILQNNTRSMNASERIEELFQEVQGAKWDVILVSGTWRPNDEVWESNQGHIVMDSGKFTNKHSVAIILNRRWRQRVNWVECVSERVIAASISVHKQPITLVITYMPHSGYPEHQVEKMYDMILRVIGTDKSMKMIGGDLNAELGPGMGVGQASVGHYTLIKANCRGEWVRSGHRCVRARFVISENKTEAHAQ